MPTVGAVITAVFYLIVWGKGLEAAISTEQSARIRMEQSAEKERVARQADRSELMAAQNQLRIEVNAQLRETKQEIKQEVRDLRRLFEKGGNGT